MACPARAARGSLRAAAHRLLAPPPRHGAAHRLLSSLPSLAPTPSAPVSDSAPALARIRAALATDTPGQSLDSRWHELRDVLLTGGWAADAPARADAFAALHAFFGVLWREGCAVHWPLAGARAGAGAVAVPPPPPSTLLTFRRQILDAVLRSWCATSLAVGAPVDVGTLNRVLQLQAAVSLPASAAAFNLFPLMGVAPDEAAFATALRACVAHSRPAAALPYLVAMRARGWTPPRDVIDCLVAEAGDAPAGGALGGGSTTAALHALRAHLMGLQAEELRADLAELRQRRRQDAREAAGGAPTAATSAARAPAASPAGRRRPRPSIAATAVRAINAAYGVPVEDEDEDDEAAPSTPRGGAEDGVARVVGRRWRRHALRARGTGPESTSASGTGGRLAHRGGGGDSIGGGDDDEALRDLMAAVAEAAAAGAAEEASDGDEREGRGGAAMQRDTDADDDSGDDDDDEEDEDDDVGPRGGRPFAITIQLLPVPPPRASLPPGGGAVLPADSGRGGGGLDPRVMHDASVPAVPGGGAASALGRSRVGRRLDKLRRGGGGESESAAAADGDDASVAGAALRGRRLRPSDTAAAARAPRVPPAINDNRSGDGGTSASARDGGDGDDDDDEEPVYARLTAQAQAVRAALVRAGVISPSPLGAAPAPTGGSPSSPTPADGSGDAGAAEALLAHFDVDDSPRVPLLPRRRPGGGGGGGGRGAAAWGSPGGHGRPGAAPALARFAPAPSRRPSAAWGGRGDGTLGTTSAAAARTPPWVDAATWHDAADVDAALPLGDVDGYGDNGAGGDVRLPAWLLRAAAGEVGRQRRAAALVRDAARYSAGDASLAALPGHAAAAAEVRILARLAFAGRHAVFVAPRLLVGDGGDTGARAFPALVAGVAPTPNSGGSGVASVSARVRVAAGAAEDAAALRHARHLVRTRLSGLGLGASGAVRGLTDGGDGSGGSLSGSAAASPSLPLPSPLPPPPSVGAVLAALDDVLRSAPPAYSTGGGAGVEADANPDPGTLLHPRSALSLRDWAVARSAAHRASGTQRAPAHGARVAAGEAVTSGSAHPPVATDEARVADAVGRALGRVYVAMAEGALPCPRPPHNSTP